MNETEDPDRAAFRRSLGIPDAAASCHTAFVDRFAIEGHVPVRAVRRLLDERPNVVGLALPGMPSDAPGMGGNEDSWDRQPVVAVQLDGELLAYDY